MQDGECACKQAYVNELSRLEVLTDLCEFAEKQRAEGSLFTDGWADGATVTKWRETIGYLKTALPKCVVEDFENGRRRQKEFRVRLSRANS